MTRYFAQNTPRAGLEHMMMSVPGFQKRGGGMMILSRFCYKPEDVDCRYCLHYRRRSCQVRTCPYIAERLKSGAIEYHATEGYYQNIGEDGFTEADHIRLRDALMRIEGKFLLSYNDDAFVRGLYDRPGIYLMETTRINNIKQRYDNGAQFPELLIANYDLRERSRAVPSQMTLFDWNGGEAIG